MLQHMRKRGMEASAARYEQQHSDAVTRARQIQELLESARSSTAAAVEDTTRGETSSDRGGETDPNGTG
jgi:hypothetical protein